MSTDPRRHPAEFLDEVREMNARLDEYGPAEINPGTADQMRAADRDARALMGESHDHVRVVDVEVDERSQALLLALSAAATRRGLRSPYGPDNPRPEPVDLTKHGRPGHCDVCDARAYRVEEIYSQYGPYIFR